MHFLHHTLNVHECVFIVVRELDLTSFDHVDNTPDKERQFRIALHELPGRVVDRATDVRLPVPFIAGTSQTRFGARRTGLRFLREYSLGLRVINDCHRIAALALTCAIDTCRQVGFMQRSVGGLRYLGLGREITRKPIFTAGKLDPFLANKGDATAIANVAEMSGVRRIDYSPPTKTLLE